MYRCAQFFILLSLIALALSSFGQSNSNVEFKTNKTVFELGDELIISIIITEMDESDVSNFPKIDGFKKRNKTVSHTKIKKDGKPILRHIINQTYIAKEVGQHLSPNFEFVINDENFSFEARYFVINGEESEINATNIAFEGNSDFQLFLFASDSKVKVGQGFEVNVGFYVPKSNTNDIAFGKSFNNELLAIQKKIEPENSLINRLNIKAVSGSEIIFQNKPFIKYLLYKAVFYPLKNGNIYFPSVELSIDLTLQSDSSKSVSKKFRSNPYTVSVEDLPEHPLKNKVPVGMFQLKNVKATRDLNTGKIYTYSFTVAGNGNFKTMTIPKPDNDTRFDFYPPETIENLPEGSLIGEKTFRYKFYPRDTGNIDIGVYFPLIYFNPKTEKYDTLTQKRLVSVTGEPLLSSNESGLSIYSNIENLDIGEKEVNINKIIKNIANIILILLLVAVIFLLNWKKQE